MKKKIQNLVALVMCLCLCVSMTVPAFAATSKDLARENCFITGSNLSAESTGICGGIHYAGDVADPIQQTVSYQEGYKNVTDAVTDTVRWTLKDGVLTFSGNGSTAMGLNCLFEGNKYIETVVIEEGITNMPGLGYFQNIPNLKTIIIMDAGTYYNQLAYNCPNLKHIIVGANLKDSIFTGGTTFEFDKTILLSKNVASYATSEYATGITCRNDCNVYVHKTTSGQFITDGVISDTSGWNGVSAKNFFRDNTVVPYSQILAAAQSALVDVPASVLAKLPAELFEEPKEEPVVPVEPVIPVEPVQPTEPVAPEETTPETMIGTNDVANGETHLRTSYNESNYVDISVSGNTLTVSGRILVDGLTEVQVKCGSKKENIRVSSGELFSAQLALTHSGKAAVNVYTYLGVSTGWSFVYNRIYIEKTTDGYQIIPSLVQENNTAFEQGIIDPQTTLDAEVPASVAAMSNVIVGSVTDDYTKVFLLHKWVAENIYYDYDAYYDRSQRITDSAGVLEARRSVCEGYSRLLRDLILAQGIPAMYCTNMSTDGSYALSTSGGELHAHTEAYVSGRWITMDATWDSNNKYRNGTYTTNAPAGYYYFDISSEAFAMDHKIASRGGESYVTDDSGFGISPDDRVLRTYKGNGGVVVIPDGVTEIGYEAFAECDSITGVIIPDSVTTIDEGAFAYCRNLVSVVLPDSITIIGKSAFGDCSSLKSVVIPDSVTTIEAWTFAGCSSLTSVTLPDSITAIGMNAFYNCLALTDVTIPGSAELDQNVFLNCTGLKSVTICDGVTAIPASTFYNCSGLTSVTIPASVTYIGYDAFRGCNNLAHIYYGGSEANWNAVKTEKNNDSLVNAEIHYGSSTPEQDTDAAIIGNKTVSKWAQASVADAIELGIVPETGLGSDYTKAITRAQFCALAVELYETCTGETINANASFNDTTDTNVLKMATIGIVNGYGGGVFGPSDLITREQSATMLYRLREAIFAAVHEKYDETYTPDYSHKNTDLPFNDAPASWAKEGVQYCYTYRIMNGYSDTVFGCHDAYSIEQSIITMARTFMEPYDIINGG